MLEENYGVPRDIFVRMKILCFYVVDAACVGGSGFLASLIAQKLFPQTQPIQMLLFDVMTSVIAFYLLLPANGGKKNWHSFYILLIRRKKRWVSFDWDREGKI